VEIRVGKNESLDDAIKRFTTECKLSGLFDELERRKYYKKPTLKRKDKDFRALKRRIREARLQAWKDEQRTVSRGSRQYRNEGGRK